MSKKVTSPSRHQTDAAGACRCRLVSQAVGREILTVPVRSRVNPCDAVTVFFGELFGIYLSVTVLAIFILLLMTLYSLHA